MKKKEIAKRELSNKRGGCVEDKCDEQEGNRCARTPRFASQTPCTWKKITQWGQPAKFSKLAWTSKKYEKYFNSPKSSHRRIQLT